MLYIYIQLTEGFFEVVDNVMLLNAMNLQVSQEEFNTSARLVHEFACKEG